MSYQRLPWHLHIVAGLCRTPLQALWAIHAACGNFCGCYLCHTSEYAALLADVVPLSNFTQGLGAPPAAQTLSSLRDDGSAYQLWTADAAISRTQAQSECAAAGGALFDPLQVRMGPHTSQRT